MEARLLVGGIPLEQEMRFFGSDFCLELRLGRVKND